MRMTDMAAKKEQMKQQIQQEVSRTCGLDDAMHDLELHNRSLCACARGR